jgi:hypothetical protein
MSFQFIEVSPAEVLLDNTQVERDDGFVYAHLKRYCSKFTPLPAITVNVVDGKLSAVRGHKYLAIAREMGHEAIRAVLQNGGFDELKAQGVKGLLSALPESKLEEEQSTDVIDGWHVFFFKSPLSSEIAQAVRTRFSCFLNETLPAALPPGMAISIESSFDCEARCLELKFPTPVTNTRWLESFRAFCLEIHSTFFPIETYQGRRFG